MKSRQDISDYQITIGLCYIGLHISLHDVDCAHELQHIIYIMIHNIIPMHISSNRPLNVTKVPTSTNFVSC